MATHEPSLGAVPPPARVASRADAPQLGVRGERRLHESGALRRDRGRAAATIPASSCRAHPSASASTGTSSGRCRSCPPRRTTSRSPTRTTAGTRTSSRSCCARSATRSSCTATPASSTRTASCSPTPTGRSGATTTTTSRRVLMANSVTGRGLAVPARSARLRAAVPARAVPPLPRPLARPHRAGARRRRVRRRARSTTTSSTARRCSGTPRRTAMTRARRPPPRLAPARCATASACGGSPTSWTRAGCSSSPRS